jgi:dihydroflavonol-4-reductase
VSVVILGAAGFLGVNLVERLLADGAAPRCVRRRRTNVLHLRALGAQMVEAELHDAEALARALDRAELVYHLAGHYPRFSNDPAATLATGLTELEVVLGAAAKAKVGRMIFVSSTATVAGHPFRPSTELDVYLQAPGLGVYHDLKWSLEARALAEDRFPVTVVCPGACLGPWDLRNGTSSVLLQFARREAPEYPEGNVSWVDVRDVALGLSRLGEITPPERRLVLVAKSEAMSHLGARVAERYGVEPRPPLEAEVARQRADLEEARARAGGPRPNMARELVDLIVHGPRIDAEWSRAQLGLEYRSFDDTLEAYEGWARRMNLIARPLVVAQERWG